MKGLNLKEKCSHSINSIELDKENQTFECDQLSYFRTNHVYKQGMSSIGKERQRKSRL